jgi:hypothetical protein
MAKEGRAIRELKGQLRIPKELLFEEIGEATRLYGK